LKPRLSNILVRSLGCKVNLADAAMIVDMLPLDQCRLVDNLDEADVFVLNTCTVTHKADRDVRKILNSIQK
jgi:threonylcarbamoyladenosine tRNA methylthiotransferase MtaB